jgi:nucleoside-diphosphate-sugar epimerase
MVELMASSSHLTSGRVVVIGSAGFIGSSLMHHLDSRYSNVVGLDRVDVDATDEAALIRLLRRGDVVINAVGYAVAGDESANGQRLFSELNVGVPIAVASACSLVGALQFIHLSSVAAMGHLEGAAVSVDARGPLLNSYARSKRLAEEELRGLAAKVPMTVLRPTSVFGRGRPLAWQMCRLASLPVVPLPGGGRANVPFTHVDNICDAIACSIAQPSTYGKTFVVGDLHSYSLRFLIEHLRQEMHVRGVTVSMPMGAFRTAIRGANAVCAVLGKCPVLDAGKLLTLTTSVEYDVSAFVGATGYTPVVSAEMGLADVAAWYRGRVSK